MLKRLFYISLAGMFFWSCAADFVGDVYDSDAYYSNGVNGEICSSTGAGRPIVLSDPAFNAYCIETLDTLGKGYVSVSEASKVTKLDCSGRGIKSLEGIEQFTNLDTLICKENLIESLNLSQNKVSVLYAYPMNDSNGKNLLDYLYVLKGQEIEYVTTNRKSAPNKRIPDETLVVAIPASKD